MKNNLDFVRQVLGNQEKGEDLTLLRPPSNYLDSRKSFDADFARIGQSLLKEGKVAVLMVAGGLSSRMKTKAIRGNLPIGPVTERSLFRLQAEKIAAIQKRLSSRMQWLVLTSPGVHSATVHTFEANGFFGVPKDDVRFFQQATLPVLDMSGKPVDLGNGIYLENPTGHGGVLDALKETSILQELIHRGIDYLFYFQYPNVLEQICDPVMLGYHHKNGLDVTTKAIMEYDSKEKMGRCTEKNGMLHILEYHFLKDLSPKSWLHAVPASIGTHVWSIAFVERCVRDGIQLPFHRIVYHDGAVDFGPLQKVEQFIFDILAFASKCGLVLVRRRTDYAAVKTPKGYDSIESARKALSELYISWLEEAGAARSDSKDNPCRIEISPLFALGPDELKRRIPPGFGFHDGLVLS